MYFLAVQNQCLIDLNIELGLLLEIKNITGINFNNHIFNELVSLGGILYLRPYPLDLVYYEETNLGQGPAIRDLIRQVPATQFEITSNEVREDFTRRLENLNMTGIVLNVNEQWARLADRIYNDFTAIFNQHGQNPEPILSELIHQPIHLYPDTIRLDHLQRQQKVEQRNRFHELLTQRFQELRINTESVSIN